MMQKTFDNLLQMLSIFGVWTPVVEDDLMAKKLLYAACRVLIFPMPVLLIIGMVLALLYNNLNEEDYLETVMMLLTVLNNFLKAVGMRLGRKYLIKIIEIIRCDKMIRLHDTEEVLIEKNYGIFLRNFFNSVHIMIGATWFAWVLPILFQNKNQRVLPVKVWTYFDELLDQNFWWFFVPDVCIFLMAAIMALHHELVLTTVLLFTCSQFDILAHRMKNIAGRATKIAISSDVFVESCESRLIQECVTHQLLIFKLAKLITKGFGFSITIQYVTCSILLTINVYNLSSAKSVDTMVVMRLLYLSCALMQMFIYCYFGNKLTSKSEEFARSLFASNWMDLSIKSKKKMLFMITRSMKSVSITKLFYIILSLDSFVSILKISYTVLNFMRRK